MFRHRVTVEHDATGHAAIRAPANLATALHAARAQLSDFVKTTVYVASSRQADLGTAWDVVHAAFGEHEVPSTLLGVTVPGYDDQLVEVEAIAIRRLPTS